MSNKSFFKKGQFLVELLLVMGLAAILLPALITGLVSSREGKVQQQQRIQAASLLKETEEAVRNIRDNGWTNLSGLTLNQSYYPAVSAGRWVMTSGTETVNGFTRTAVLSSVSRDSNGAIIESGGTVDPSSLKVTTTVSWTIPMVSSIQSIMYLTRFRDNIIYTDTLTTDFNKGTLSGTAVRNTTGSSVPNDGEVVLGTGGTGDWCSPNLSINALDLPGQGIATAISAIPGHAYVTTGGNASGDSMDSVNISDPQNPTPPVATNAGSYNNKKTYGLFAGTNYIYLTSDHPGLTVDIVNASNLTHAGYFNPSGGGQGYSVFVNGNTGYVTTSSKLFSFDTTSIQGSNSQTQLGNLNIDGIGKRVTIVGTYAYIAASSTTKQLQIVNISNPSAMQVIGNFNAGNGLGGIDVAVNDTGTRAYLITSYESGKKDFFIIDTTNKNSPTLVGQAYSTNGMNPKGIVLTPGNRAIVVGSGGSEYQVLDISQEDQPKLCGSLDNPNGASSINAIATVVEPDGDYYSYILTDNSSREFQIIAGGGNGGFATSGTFQSGIFTPGYQTAFNRFTVTVRTPVSTSIKFQVAVAAYGAGNSCNTANLTFIGPDAGSPSGYSSNGFFTLTSGSNAIIPFGTISGTSYQNPGPCFAYKAYLLTSDTTQTPVLNDFTVNYSP